jgi:uncharacterized membrane protein YkvA (DUF1232 family)
LDFGALKEELLSRSQSQETKSADFLPNVEKKISGLKIGKDFLKNLKTLIKYARTSTSPKVRWISIGALAYFLAPMDLIPDPLLVGYVDDVGVIAIAMQMIHETLRNKNV